jgi:ATP-dependent DNA helicase RecG
MESSHDGFYIAEQDLEIRGPGEFLGTRQSGIPDLKIGNIIRDRLILQAAREEAFAYIEEQGKEKDEIFQRLMYHLKKRWGDKLTKVARA